MTRYRKTQTGAGLFSAIEHEQAVAAKTTGILKLRNLIPWESFRPLLEKLTGYDQRDWRKGGKPAPSTRRTSSNSTRRSSSCAKAHAAIH
ncbi:MAG: hypothetical protein RL088_595 [Verrucomicrobiota bacterium]|jgi:hypothetical protein